MSGAAEADAANVDGILAEGWMTTDDETRQSLEAEYRKWQDDPKTMHNTVLHQRILDTWERSSPKMYAELKKAGTLEMTAFVSQQRMWAEQALLLKAGMPPTDATEEAEKGWLMLEPENDPEEEADEEAEKRTAGQVEPIAAETTVEAPEVSPAQSAGISGKGQDSILKPNTLYKLAWVPDGAPIPALMVVPLPRGSEKINQRRYLDLMTLRLSDLLDRQDDPSAAAMQVAAAFDQAGLAMGAVRTHSPLARAELARARRS